MNNKQAAIYVGFALLWLAAGAALIAHMPRAHGADVPQYYEVYRFSGNDEACTSPELTLGKHWRVVVSMTSGDMPSVKVFAKPAAGTFNSLMIDTSAPGTHSAYMSESGRYKVAVLGFGCSWTATVEQAE